MIDHSFGGLLPRLFLALVTLTLPAVHGAGFAVINEFNPKPEDTHELEEFIELHNPGDEELNLSGWSLSDAVTFPFPNGTTLPAGGYLVVAMNPAALKARFGVNALGPWSGKLNSTGETIVLKNASGVIQDSVDYKFGFPWPCKIDGEGSSAELIHPSLDNSKGSAWRSSGTSVTDVSSATYIPVSTFGWKFLKARSEAPTAWREVTFDDSDWGNSQAPFGYGDPDIATPFNDMAGNFGYAGAYFRKTFELAAGAIPQSLHMRLNVDDGCVVWINGVEVKRRNVPAGPLAYNSFSVANVEQAWEDVTIENAGEFLVAGVNVVAVHGLNSNLNSGDFFFNLELKNQAGGPPTSLPTPGARNSVYQPSNLVPPYISKVSHTPAKPTSGQDVTVTATLSDPDGVGSVDLEYQLVDPGNYIRLTDPEYQLDWRSISMVDDGTWGDVTAGDGIYTAVVPGNNQSHRRLTRYRLRFGDRIGNTSLAPFGDDIQSNFAWFTYDGAPAWQGALRPDMLAPGDPTPITTFSSTANPSIPVYTLIGASSDVMNSQYNGGYNKIRFRGTFVADGVVYDHIEFRNRGQGSTYHVGKNKWRFSFNPGYDFQAVDHFGKPYEETWGSFSANANSGPWAPLHKGSLGVEEAASLKIYQLAGVPSPSAHYYQFRVIRDVEEARTPGEPVYNAISPGGWTDGQYVGDYWGTYLAIERIKGGFLDSRGLPDGNIYKIEGNGGQAENLVPGQAADGSDWGAFSNASMSNTQTEQWWRANLDMDAYYTFHAINRLVGNVDLRQGENHFFFRRVTTDGRWVPIPWDLDMMFIAKSHQGTTIRGTFYPGVIDQHRSIVDHPNLALEYRNRAREILDLMASDGTPNGGQIGQLFDEFASIVAPAGTTDNLANAEAALWNLHPRARGSVNNFTGLGDPSGQGNHRGNFFRAEFSDSRMGGNWFRQLRAPGFRGVPNHQDLVDYFVGYATDTFTSGGSWAVNNGNQYGYGYQYLLAESADTQAPQRPILTYTGPGDHPVDQLTFSATPFKGLGGYASSQWRIAEISAPGIPGYVANQRKYEITSTWAGNNTSAQIGFPAAAVTVGKTYRARVRHLSTNGRWSRWSEPVQFVVGTEAARVAHYWDFNSSNLEVALQPRVGVGSAITTAAGANTEFTTGNDQGFAGQNARYGSPAGRHLRVNNPIGAEVIFKLPTTGFEKLALTVESRRSGSGAGTQTWSYTLDGETYLPLGEIAVVDGTPEVVGWDFKAIAGADHNPEFAVKVSFSQGAGGTVGNNRFDNLVLTGTPLPGSYAEWVSRHFDSSAQLDLSIAGMNADPDGDGRTNFHEFVLNTSPQVADLPAVAFVWSLDGSVPRPALKFERPAGVIGAIYELQTNTSLAADGWQTVSTVAAEQTKTAGVESVVFRDPVANTSSPRYFCRLKITPTAGVNP
jgi:hypothetical protein